MIQFNVDPLTEEMIEKIQPLLEENHAVSGQFDVLDIYWEQYLAISDSILLITITDDDRYVGILMLYMGIYPHNKNERYAEQITFFIQNEYRSQSKKMMTLSEDLLKAHDCSFVIQSARYGSSFCDKLERRGYKPLDIKFAKRLR